jgi:outer membrane protein
VDLQAALNESNAGKKAKEAFKAQMSRLEKKLESGKKKIDKLKAELEKKALLLKEDERVSLERDYRHEARDFKRLYEHSKQELELKDRELTTRVLIELRQIIYDLREQRNNTIILEGNNTVDLFGAKAIDHTETVISSYNKKGTKIAQINR